MEHLPFRTHAAATLVVLVVLSSLLPLGAGCKTSNWRNMTMEELLLKSDIVLYGKDRDHGKLRLPTELDTRFDVYCVIKTGQYLVPGQVIIENINDADDACSGVRMQTEEGKKYIVGLSRTFSGYMKYAEINPLQKTAFAATSDNLDALAATCGLDEWTVPKTGNQDMCPVPNKPRFCTKVRDPSSQASVVSSPYSVSAILLNALVVCWIWCIPTV